MHTLWTETHPQASKYSVQKQACHLESKQKSYVETYYSRIFQQSQNKKIKLPENDQDEKCTSFSLVIKKLMQIMFFKL